jgi:hypothetical protein
MCIAILWRNSWSTRGVIATINLCQLATVGVEAASIFDEPSAIPATRPSIPTPLRPQSRPVPAVDPPRIPTHMPVRPPALSLVVPSETAPVGKNEPPHASAKAQVLKLVKQI